MQIAKISQFSLGISPFGGLNGHRLAQDGGGNGGGANGGGANGGAANGGATDGGSNFLFPAVFPPAYAYPVDLPPPTPEVVEVKEKGITTLGAIAIGAAAFAVGALLFKS